MNIHSLDPSFILSATVDFPDDVRYGRYSIGRIDEMMTKLKDIGVSRVYWLYYGDVDLDSNWAGNIFHKMQYGQHAIERIGEPISAAVPIAHKYGMELYGVLKPYNTGGSSAIPEGSPIFTGARLKTIGGEVEDGIPFISNHPYTRLKRRLGTLDEQTDVGSVRRIKLIKSDDSSTRITSGDIQIWTSQNNYKYTRRQIKFGFIEDVEPCSENVVDYYGEVVTAKGDPVRTITLDELQLDDKYILITTGINTGTSDFMNTASGMVKVYSSGSEPLPIVVATRSGTGRSNRNFEQGGLDYDNGFGSQQMFLDSDNNSALPYTDRGNWWRQTSGGGVVAFSRGVNQYLPSTPCEVYPEVRDLWDGWVDRIIETGVDGIDIRVSHHGCLVNDPQEYGFNDLVVQKFVQIYGSEPTNSQNDLGKLSKVRGEYFTDFIKLTSNKVRSAGKKMQIHMHTEAFRQDPCHGQMMGIPPNIYFDWKSWISQGLLDGITLRTSWFEALESPSEDQAYRAKLSYRLDDEIVKEALSMAVEYNIPTYLNRYVDRAIGIDEYLKDLETTFFDARFAGFDIYEFAHLARPVPDGSRLEEYRGRLGAISQKTRALGII